jgi:PAS domain S-box-containing protein
MAEDQARQPEIGAVLPKHTRLSRVADACALFTVAVGLLVVAGWMLNIDSLKRVLPGLVTVKFNTALGLVLAGTGLWWRKRTSLRLALGAFVTLLGALTLGQYLAGLELGIDQLFFRDILGAPEAAFAPGRMAPSTALCFLLFGVALIGSGETVRRPAFGSTRSAAASRGIGYATELLALTATVISGFSLVAYPTGAVYLRQLPGSVSMALGTAAAFAVLGVGILCAVEGIIAQSVSSQGTGRLLWIGFGVLTCLLITIGVVFAINIQILAEDVDAQANVARPRREATLELENGVLAYGLAVRLALAGDTRAQREASDDAIDLDRHVAEYTALAATDRQRELATRFATEWRKVRAIGAALLAGAGGQASAEQLAGFSAHRLRLVKFVEDEMRPEAVKTFETRKTTTLRDLKTTGDFPLLLLVVSVLIALLTSGTVAWAVSRQERTVREQREWLRVTLSSIGDGIIACDTQRRVTFLNPVSESLTGWKAEEALGQPIATVLRLINERTREQGADIAEQVLREGRVVAMANHTALVTRDGREVPIEDSAAPITDTLGNTAGAVLVFHDVTQRRRVADELRESEARLRAANERLVEADQRKNEFLAVLSHELRNPLAPIRNSLHILERAAPGGDQARRAQAVIERQVGQLSHLVDDLLDVTRISRNKIRLEREVVELNELVRRTVEDHRSLFDKREVHIEVEFAREHIHVNADVTRLAQVVGNLLQNAAKFTGRGGRVKVFTSVDRVGRQTAIHVSDTGVGMPPEVLARLFQPFVQADTTLDRSKGGLGLGLALVKGLVELHGGEIRAYSDGLGKGAEFVVRLPLAPEGVAAAEKSRDGVQRAGRRVLIIEDNMDAADSLREALEFGGHEVAVAYNGPDGLAKAHQFRPEIVLCDIGLPGIDGYEVARTFRADDSLKGVFLVALSGYALPEDLQRASEAGFEKHLAKPPSLEKLEELLAQAPAKKTSKETPASTRMDADP